MKIQIRKYVTLRKLFFFLVGVLNSALLSMPGSITCCMMSPWCTGEDPSSKPVFRSPNTSTSSMEPSFGTIGMIAVAGVHGASGQLLPGCYGTVGIITHSQNSKILA
jgi:hypothetical protein